MYQGAIRNDQYQPKQKDLVKGNQKNNIELNILMSKDIKINTKMYQNFLGAVLESDEPGAAAALPEYKRDVEAQADLPEKLEISKD